MFESSLHSRLKTFYTLDGGSTEIWVDGYIIDVVKSQELIEIQTGNFSALKTKLGNLLPVHRIRIVLPIPLEKFIILRDVDQNLISRRRSPKKGCFEHLFYDLVYISKLASHPNFSLEVLLTSEEEDRISNGKGSWRRRGISIVDRRLVSILGRAFYPNSKSYISLIPTSLPAEFTNSDLSNHSRIPIRLASKMTYTLLQMGVLEKIGRNGRSAMFSRVQNI